MRLSILSSLVLLGLVTSFMGLCQGAGSSPPHIGIMNYPQRIRANGDPYEVSVGFNDIDGDIVLARYAVVEAVDFEPFAFDPKIEGQTDGEFTFSLSTTVSQKVTVELWLVDREGNKSEPRTLSLFALAAIVPEDYETIQAAINAVSEGSIIYVAPGMYAEHLLIEKSLTLQGNEGVETTINSVKRNKPVIVIRSNQHIDVTIEGFTIKRPGAQGMALDHVIDQEGYGIAIQGEACSNIRGNKILCEAYRGISVEGFSQATIDNNQIVHNWIGITVADDARAIIDGNKISCNWIGVNMDDRSKATIQHNFVSQNTCAGIWMDLYSEATVEYNRVFLNRKGIVLDGSSWAIVNDNQILGSEDCGVYSSPSCDCQASIQKNTISGEYHLADYYGGYDYSDGYDGIVVGGSPKMIIWRNKIVGIRRYAVTLMLSVCRFQENTFEGQVVGSGNDTTRGFCPRDLDFLISSAGGSYGKTDTTPPELVKDFGAVGGRENQSVLSWTNPRDVDLAEVIVRRKRNGYPGDERDGIVIFRDTSPSPSTQVEYVDTGLYKEFTYYYAVFSRDYSQNWNNTVEESKNADVAVLSTIEEKRPPNTPINLAQMLPNGTYIPVGEIIEMAVVLCTGVVDDPDGDRVKLQVELRRLDELGGGFDDTLGGLKGGALISSGSQATCTAEGLIPGSYHWRARVVDEHGLTSDWVDFGGNTIEEVDFRIRTAETSTRFAVGEHVRVTQGTSMWEEPRTGGEVLHRFTQRTTGKVLQSEATGSFFDGDHWWYIEARDGIFSYSGWCREADLEKNQIPEASFTYFPTTFRCGEDVTLDASGSSDPDGAVVAYWWDLDGDGEYDGYTTSPQIVYYWDRSGKQDVRLKVEDDNLGTDEMTKTLSVGEISLWEKIERFFGSPPKFSRDWLREIKLELQIKNYSSQLPVLESDPADPFYWYSDWDLAEVLVQEMDKENAPGVTYGTYILDSIREKNLVRMASSAAWQNKETVNAYFNDLAAVNVWAGTAGTTSTNLLVGLIKRAGGSGLGISTLLSLPALCEAGIGLKALDNTLYRRALWHYFEYRRSEDVNDAFEDAGVPPRYYKGETKAYFESLWETCQEFGGDLNLETTWRANLQDFLLAALEKYKFYTQIVLLKSAGELRVYDSQNRVTGLVNGEVKQEIPNSIYDEESKTAVISPATDSYRYVVVGVEQGDYGLDAISITGGEATICTVTEMATAIGAVHQYTMNWDALSKGETGTTLQVDKNGDGVFEKTYQAGSKLEESHLSTYLAGRTSLWLWIVVGLAIGSVGVVVGGIIWTRILRKS